MDIKSIKIRYTLVFKFLLITLCVLSVLSVGFGVLNAQSFEKALGEEPYKSSDENFRNYYETYELIYNVLMVYRSEEYIQSGKTLDNQMIAEANKAIMSNQQYEISDLKQNYENWIHESESNNALDEVNRLQLEQAERLEQINEKTNNALDQVRDQLIQQELVRYKALKLQLMNNKDFVFQVDNGLGDRIENVQTVMDVNTFLKQLPDAMVIGDYTVTQFGTGVNNRHLNGHVQNLKGFIGLTEDGFNQREYDYLYQIWEGRRGMVALGLGLVVFLISTLSFAAVVGNRNKQEVIKLTVLDFPYLDIATIVIVGSILLLIRLLVEWGGNSFGNVPIAFFYVIASLIIITGTLLGLYWIRLVSIRIKRGEFIKHTLIYQILNFVFGGFVRGLQDMKEAILKGSLTRKLVLEGVLYALATIFALLAFPVLTSMFGLFGAILALGLLLALNIFVFKKKFPFYKAIQEINEGVRIIGSGQYEYRIDDSGFDADSKSLAEGVHTIANGFEIAVQNELKSEKMKSELVTNVSHDLKTPLTSLITYVDLLKKEDLPTDQAKEYLDVIDAKVERLRTLIEDLFEAAKASSGTLAVQAEEMDFAELLTQGLGEISEQIASSGLDFKVSITEKPLMVEADGKLLWRIMENLITNAIKYSLPQSRVYVDLSLKDEWVMFTIKNISQFELNMPVQELTERFKRGDESRNGEGSGLGLSIAKSFTELMNGKFLVEIDGDLFKVTVRLKHLKQDHVNSAS